MALRCAYIDLDGTLLGANGSLLRDADGNFSSDAVRALEACHRAGVEVVLQSGRRRAQVMEDSRLIGQTSYVYETGCAVVIDGEVTVLTGDLKPDDDATVYDKIEAAGVPDLLLETYGDLLELHSPWHLEREFSFLFRGLIDIDEANAMLEREGHGNVRLLDNGAIGRRMRDIPVTHCYHLVPEAASKANGVQVHMRARGYAPEECIGLGDSLEDLEVATVVGHFFIPANGPERDESLREAIGAYENVTVTEGNMGTGVYEAIVSTLAAR
jgi:hydroxymethylpyrimidine pyrophosphatase-like HAD family hydrolase